MNSNNDFNFSLSAPGCREFGGFAIHSAMRFQCQPGCIRCCEQKGFVYVTREDIARLAEHLGITRAEFKRRYLCGTAPLLRFRKQRQKQCPFLLSDGCSVHEVKPLQCRSFPYWPELLDKASERREAAAFCPGMNRGPLVNIEAAREIANEVQRAFPQLYEEGEE
jgi:hypothetical protein